MGFKMKYDIDTDYLTKGSMKRPGNNIKVLFIVAHDTGNPGSTAKGNVSYYKRVQNQSHASAHLFVDDERILECIPALKGKPERAYHVIYDVTTDNVKYGDDANDAAIGVELCWGKGINHSKAYKRYVWVLAYICYKFGLDPKRDIIGHDSLDPRRKIDPTNGLKHMGKTFNKLITDVVKEYKACTGGSTAKPQTPTSKDGKTRKIKAGDTLYAIAKAEGTTVAKLKALNPELDVHALPVGGTILLQPKEKGKEPSKQTPIYGTISKSNPTISHLAVDYDTTISEIERLNPGINPRKLKIGQKIVVGYKDKKSSSGSSSSKGSGNSELDAYLKHKPIRPYPGKALGVGAKGKDVEAIQRAVGASVDGIYGKETKAKVAAYQERKGFLAVDGIVGYNTWNVMF